jgi:hypothetical protein
MPVPKTHHTSQAFKSDQRPYVSKICLASQTKLAGKILPPVNIDLFLMPVIMSVIVYKRLLLDDLSE